MIDLREIEAMDRLQDALGGRDREAVLRATAGLQAAIIQRLTGTREQAADLLAELHDRTLFLIVRPRDDN